MKRRSVYRLTFRGRRLLSAACIAIAIAPGCHVFDLNDPARNTDYSATQSFYFAVEVRQQTRLQLLNVNGPVRLVGVPGVSQVEVWGERRVESDSRRDADLHLDDLRVQLTDSAEELRIETDQPENAGGRNYIVTYNVVVPIEWDVLVATVNSKVAVDSLQGDLFVGLTNGDVNFNELYGNLQIELVNGKAAGAQVLPPGGSSRIAVVNGQIELDLPAATSAEFSAEVTNGSVQVRGLTLHNAVTANNSVRGRLGLGDGAITLSAVNGTIDVVGYE